MNCTPLTEPPPRPSVWDAVSDPVSERPPAYIRRTNELRLEAKARFEAAVQRRINTAGRIQL